MINRSLDLSSSQVTQALDRARSSKTAHYIFMGGLHKNTRKTHFLKNRLPYCATHSTVRHMATTDNFGKLELELRRGVVVLATLSQLRKPRYGYELRQALSEQGMAIEEGTLYPLLRRLETQGLLQSEWKIEDGPPRRYYSLNADGKKLLKQLTESWQSMNEVMGRLLQED
jgi:DNA-binding PadR family transcriptional regulator